MPDNILYRMLDRLRERPGMWLGTVDIDTLKTYISGYRAALTDAGVCTEDPKSALFPLDFWFMHEFAKIKTNSYESTSGWAHLIREECGGDGKIALERFFEYLDEFRSLKAVSLKKALLTEENILANDDMLFSRVVSEEGEMPVYDSPQAVYIIELTDGIGFLCAVETARDIRLKRYIFREDEIFGEEKCFHSPEHVFGKLPEFEEADTTEYPVFNKPVLI